MTVQALDPAYSSGPWEASTVGYMPPSPRPYVPMNDLARLIHRRKEELDLSWYDIADRGGFSSHTIVYTLAKKPEHRQPPRAETLTRLARALEIDEDIVRAAAASAAGYDMSRGTPTTLEVAEDLRVISDAMEQMSSADRAKVRRIALSFLEESATSLAGKSTAAEDARKAAQTAKLRQELSEAADKVPGPTGSVRSISAKRPRTKKTT